MATWTDNELNKIGTAEELAIASLRADGTMRNPVTIWVVRLGSDLYVRSAYGRESGWFRGVQARHAGHVQAGGINKDVTFEEIAPDNSINDQLDNAYRTKYRRHSKNIVEPMSSPGARSATLRLVPR